MQKGGKRNGDAGMAQQSRGATQRIRWRDSQPFENVGELLVFPVVAIARSVRIHDSAGTVGRGGGDQRSKWGFALKARPDYFVINSEPAVARGDAYSRRNRSHTSQCSDFVACTRLPGTARHNAQRPFENISRKTPFTIPPPLLTSAPSPWEGARIRSAVRANPRRACGPRQRKHVAQRQTPHVSATVGKLVFCATIVKHNNNFNFGSTLHFKAF